MTLLTSTLFKEIETTNHFWKTIEPSNQTGTASEIPGQVIQVANLFHSIHELLLSFHLTHDAQLLRLTQALESIQFLCRYVVISVPNPRVSTMGNTV